MENTLFYVVATSFLVAYVTEVAKNLAKLRFKFSEAAKKNHPRPSKSFGVAILIIIIR